MTSWQPWHNKTLLWWATLLLGCCAQCTAPSNHDPLIAISWYYPKQDYQNWIRHSLPEARFVELYAFRVDQLDSVLETCQGLFLSGGSDIQPAFYQGVDSSALCGAFNPHRDSVEWTAAHYALQHFLPTLGVCRGMQMINVSLGGSLVLDLLSQKGLHSHQQSQGDAWHKVIPSHEGRALFGARTEQTNSNHHQAIDRLGNGLYPVCWSADSVIEAVHYQGNHPFMWGVQWHPERMDPSHPMVAPLLDSFLTFVQKR
jgi:putative glutamine amidotransferase